MPTGVYLRTEAHRERMRLRPVSVRSLANLDRTGLRLSEATKEKIGRANKGRKFSDEFRKTQSEIMKEKHKLGLTTYRKKGFHLSVGQREHLRDVNRRRVEEGTHNFWRGGLTEKNKLLRGSLEYKLWRESVFSRDDYTCVWCRTRGGRLEADHIKPFALFPELRFAIDNGRTLCKECHKKTDTYGSKTSTLRRKQNGTNR